MPFYVHDLDELNPDDPRPPSQQIANLLRAAVKTGKLQPGERLPSQNELADRYGVARETIKAALRVLSQERLVISRQGSGAFVRAQTERPVGLRPHVEAAFERPHVSIDFAGFSGETLHGALTEPLDKVRAGRVRPESIFIRMLLPDLTAATDVPKAVNAAKQDPAVRERARHISLRATEGISDAVNELADLGLVKSATVQTRVYTTSPGFKLYILNGEEAFFGFYPVVKHRVTIDGAATNTFDTMGKDATLFYFNAQDEDTYGEYVNQARAWFESVWTTVAREPTE